MSGVHFEVVVNLPTKSLHGRWLIPFLFLIVGISFVPSTVDAQNYWVPMDRPTARNLRDLSFLGSLTGWAAGDSGTIVKTSDGAETWTVQTSPIGDKIVEIMMHDTTFGWAIAQYNPHDTVAAYGTTLLRTTNGGEEWFVQQVFQDEFLNAVAFVDSANGCLGGHFGRIYWTSDGGVNWTPAIVDSADYAQWPIFTMKFFTQNIGMASGGVYDWIGMVWKTTDGGRFWTHDRVAGEPVFGIHFADSMNITCVGGDLDLGAIMVKSTDGGQTWQYTYLAIWGQATAIAFRTPVEAWAPLSFATTFMYSLDSANTWTSFYTPDTSAYYDIVFTDSSTGYMVGDFGAVSKYVGPPVGIPQPSTAMPVSPALLQNYPNPFNPGTRIRYEVRTKSLVTLHVYDITGRHVSELAGGLKEPGIYEARFHDGGLSTGVYMCVIQIQPVDGSSGYSRAVKMVLAR